MREEREKPTPERKKSKPKRPYTLEYRYTKKLFFDDDTNWRIYWTKYETKTARDNALKQLKKQGHDFIEYRIGPDLD